MDRDECPPTGELADLVGGDLSGDERERLALHVEGCAACQGRLDCLLSNDSIASWGRAISARAVPGPDEQFLAEMRALVPRVAMSPVELATATGGPDTSRVEADDRCPAIVGGYEILGVLGRGGMAVVYRARQPRVGRVVALKRLRFPDQDNADVARFLREAEAAARVRHPNVVQVYEVGDDSGRPFIALELVEGGTLADALTGSPVDPWTAATLIEKAARAVHAAHQQGVVHRDLKPANILLAPGDHGNGSQIPTLTDCEPKVTDFGLARRVGDDRRVTMPDMLSGTPAYLAPEQVSGPADVASPSGDIYALGAILYEMLTGRPPLLGPTVLATLRLVEGATPVPPRRLHPGLPRDLEAVCLKCLEKDPRRRYPTAAALADDLDRFLTGRPTVARPLSTAGRAAKLVRRYPLPAALAAVLVASLVAGLAGVLWQWRAAVAARSDLTASLAAEADQRREAEQNLYIARLVQANTLWEGGEAARARDLLAACRPAPGQADLRGWEWNYLDRQFHAETRIIPLAHWVNGLAVLPTDPPELAMAIGRAKLNRTYKPGPADGQAGFLNPLVDTPSLRPGPNLPGAAMCVAAAGPTVAWGTNTGHVVLADRGSGRPARTIAVTAPVTGLGLTPDGQRVVVVTEGGHIRVFMVDSGDQVAAATAPSGGPHALAVNSDGTTFACGVGRGRVQLYDLPDLRPGRELAGLSAACTALCFSPDGTWLAVGCGDGSVAVRDTADGREVRRFRVEGGPVYAVAFRPDGRAIAVAGTDRAVRVIDAKYDRVLATFRGHEASVRSLAFMAGGAVIVSGAQDGSVRVWDATHDIRGRCLPFSEFLNDVAFCPSAAGLLIRAADLNGSLSTWSAVDGRAVGRVTVPLRHRAGYPIRYMAFLNGGRQIGAMDREEPAAPSIWDAGTGKRLVRLPPITTMPYLAVAADSAGRRFAWATAAADGGGVDVYWRDSDGRLAAPIHLNAPSLRALAVDPTGDRLAALAIASRPDEDQAVWVIDTAGRSVPRAVARGAAMYGGLAFSPDGRHLAMTTRDVVQVYATDTWDHVRQTPCTAATTCLSFSPDGRRLAAVGYDGVVTLYDQQTGKEVFQLHGLAPGRPDDVAANARVAFSPDGAWLVSTNWDGSLNLWDGAPPAE